MFIKSGVFPDIAHCEQLCSGVLCHRSRSGGNHSLAKSSLLPTVLWGSRAQWTAQLEGCLEGDGLDLCRLFKVWDSS